MVLFTELLTEIHFFALSLSEDVETVSEEVAQAL